MIYIKLLLCILIVLAGVLSGQLKAKRYENRVSHLQALITMLKLLETEMKYRLDPLPDIFRRLSENRSEYFAKLLLQTSELLETGSYNDFSDCWNQAINETYAESTLTKKDIYILKDIGFDLGKTDLEGQSNLFHRTMVLFEEQLEEAMEEKKVKGKMYKSLGAAVGVLIVILFI